MAGKRKVAAPERKITVQVVQNWNVAPVHIGDGFAVPPAFRITSTLHGLRQGPVDVDVDVEITDGRARTHRISIGAENPSGVTSSTLRAIPIRDIVATGIRHVLMNVELTPTGAKTSPVTKVDARAIAAVKRLVGYVEGSAS